MLLRIAVLLQCEDELDMSQGFVGLGLAARGWAGAVELVKNCRGPTQ